MKDKKIEIIARRIEREFLPFVRRPARYIGGEVNQVRKDLSRCDLTVALCFPDVYEIGMSNTGMPILYHILNQMDGVAAERVFAPWTDAEEILRQKQIPLFSLESKATLRQLRRDRLRPDERAVLHERPEHPRPGGAERPPERPQGGRSARHRRRRHGELLRADGRIHRPVRARRGRRGGRGAGRVCCSRPRRAGLEQERDPAARPPGGSTGPMSRSSTNSSTTVRGSRPSGPPSPACEPGSRTPSWRISRMPRCRRGPSSRSSRRSTSGSASRSCGAARADAGSARPATAGVPFDTAAPRRSSNWPRHPTTRAASTP